jgi:hypothetical protein
MIIPNHRVKEVIYRTPTDMVSAAQTTSDVRLAFEVGQRGCRKALRLRSSHPLVAQIPALGSTAT